MAERVGTVDEVDGLELRPLTIDDAEALARLENAVAVEEGWGELWSQEEIEEELSSADAHLTRRSRVAVRPDGELAGVAWFVASPVAERAFLFLDVPMALRGELDDHLLSWAQAAAADELRSGVMQARALDTVAEPHMEQRIGLLERHGFTTVRRFLEMERPLDEPIAEAPLPDGLRIAPWEDDRSDAVKDAHDEAFRDHWGSSRPTADRWRQMTVGAKIRPDLHRLAVADDGTVAGYALVGVYEQDWEHKGIRDAWVNTLGTRRAHRGRGVASALLAEVLRAMRDEGFSHASLGVDSESLTGATRLYERHGFALTRTQLTYRVPLG